MLGARYALRLFLSYSVKNNLKKRKTSRVREGLLRMAFNSNGTINNWREGIRFFAKIADHSIDCGSLINRVVVLNHILYHHRVGNCHGHHQFELVI